MVFNKPSWRVIKKMVKCLTRNWVPSGYLATDNPGSASNPGLNNQLGRYNI